jgi:TIGR00341 family protein
MESNEKSLWQVIKGYFNALPDKENEEETIQQISSGVAFHGSNLWVLVFAVFIASLGLNVNSTAVIIGAMLISPLMGPIIGMGFGVGINDLVLLKRSIKNYLVATGISVLTATLYFLITPLNEAQSELLARTSPTLYDVLIALCGGAAGILALSTKGKGNVIPGVAIATALMPPLCTAGYGLAMGESSFFFGAFYLYFINTVFIALATFIGVRMLRFKQRRFIDDARLRKMKQYIIGIVVLTMLPAAYMTLQIIRQSMIENNVRRFVRTELSFKGTRIISQDYDTKGQGVECCCRGKNYLKEGNLRGREDVGSLQFSRL